MIRSTPRARRLPSCSSSMIRVRREVTSPYSAATKNAFSRIRPDEGEQLEEEGHAPAPRGRARTGRQVVVHANQLSRSIAGAVAADTNICSMHRRDARRVPRGAVPGALNRVAGMPFAWSLNPYMGCVHRCTFCYVRAFERRADRPSDDRYGTLDPRQGERRRGAAARARAAARGDATSRDRRRDRPLPAGRGPLPADARAASRCSRAARNPFSLITRGPLIVRDVDVLAEAARRADVSVTFSVPTLDDERLARDRAGHRAAAPAAPRAVARSSRRAIDASRRDGADPARPLRPAGAARRGRPRGARGGRVRRLGEPPLPASPGRASTSSTRLAARLARAAARVRAALRAAAPTCRGAETAPARRRSARARARSTGSATAGASRLRAAAARRAAVARSDRTAHRIAVHGRRDHRADRRRPRGRPRRPPALALARPAHPRGRRGRRRRERGRARASGASPTS